MTRRKTKSQLNISLKPQELLKLHRNLMLLMDGDKVCTWSEAVAEAARIAAEVKTREELTRNIAVNSDMDPLTYVEVRRLDEKGLS